MNLEYGLDTLALHAGQIPDTETGSRAVPIYQTTSYVFPSAETAARRFALEEAGNLYTRLGNPTNDVLEKRLAAMHGGSAAVLAASGMAAIFNTVATIASQGRNFVSTASLYGGTSTLFTHTLRRFGIEVRCVDTGDLAAVEAAVDGDTRLVYVESVGNPRGNVDDFAALADVAHRHGLPLVMDNTFTPPPIFNPFDHGVDLAVYSLTKMVGGHGVSIAGATVEKGDFDWKARGLFPEITEPDESYHGLNFWEAFGSGGGRGDGGAAFSAKVRAGLLRDVGACIAPFNAWTILLGVETLPLRARRHCESANLLAEWLEKHPLVEWVRHAGLATHPDHANAKRYMPMGPGAVFSFGVKGGYEAGKRLIDSLSLISHLANVLDAKSLIVHPASTTHQQLSDAEKAAAGVSAEMIRFSVGLEDPEDLKKDLDRALRAAAG